MTWPPVGVDYKSAHLQPHNVEGRHPQEIPLSSAKGVGIFLSVPVVALVQMRMMKMMIQEVVGVRELKEEKE